MLFHLYNVEPNNDSEIWIYGKAPSDKWSPMQTIKIFNIISPVYFLPSAGFVDNLTNEIRKFSSDIKSIELVDRKNIFYSNASQNVKLLKVYLNKKVSFENFESDYCEMIITEFSNPTEQFIIGNSIKGPGLIEFEEISSKNKRHISADFNTVKFIKNDAFPPLKTCSITTTSNNNEMCSFIYSTEENSFYGQIKSLSIYSKLKPQIFNTSKDLSSYLNSLILNDNCDIVLTHNFRHKNRLVIKDKIYCDIFHFAAGTLRGRDFSVEEIALNCGLSILDTPDSHSKALISIFKNMQALNLAKEMAEISGYILNKCLGNSRSERIEYTLLHELYSYNYLFPLSKTHTAESYAGGLVLDPSVGFYQNIVLLLDFNSLYPSIIQEFNVCFSTIDSLEKNNDSESDANNCENLIDGVIDKNHSDMEAFLPKVLRNLVTRRKNVKELLSKAKTQEEKCTYDVRQKALKLTANSMYGCLGASISRFCNYKMASYITSKGRELLQKAKSSAEMLNMNVIYGDTDSIMILTPFLGKLEFYESAIKSGSELVNIINKEFKYVEIELECAFKKFLLFSKKKYACLKFDKDSLILETKGLESGRRDFCRAGSDLLIKLLEIIMYDENENEEETDYSKGKISINKCKRIYEILNKFVLEIYKRPKEDFIINSVLARDPKQYSNANNLPHVSLAIRLENSGIMAYKQEDVVSFVIGEGSGNISSRSFHPEEKFNVDYEYYLKQHILPSVYRTLAPISNIHYEKIRLIFGSKENVIRSSGKALTLILPCCDNIQEPDFVCKKCGKESDKVFFIHKIFNLIKQGIKRLYQTRSKCPECLVNYSNHAIYCHYCNKPLRFESKNEEFDNLLINLDDSFKSMKIPEIDSILKSYSNHSFYRKFDFTKYYKKEIENFEKLEKTNRGFEINGFKRD